MEQNWHQYRVIQLTAAEEEYIDGRGLDGSLARDGREIHLIAQDDEEAIFGIPISRGGDVVVAYFGYTYQMPRIGEEESYQDALDAICERYETRRRNDSYANTLIIDMPLWKRASFLRALRRMEERFAGAIQ